MRFFESEDFDEFKGKVSFLGFQSFSLSRLGEILARGPAHQQVDPGIDEFLVVQEPRHVPEVRNVWVVVGQHGVGEREYLGEPRRFPGKRLPGYGRRADAAAHASIDEHLQELPATAYDTILDGLAVLQLERRRN